MSTARSGFITSPIVVALAGFILPGGGYLLLRQFARGITVGVAIICLFVLGLLIGGVRVIDVPGYDDLGNRVYVRTTPGGEQTRTINPAEDTTWMLLAHPVAEVVNKPWYILQVLNGGMGLIGSDLAIDASRPALEGGKQSRYQPSHSRIFEIGTLYTAITGMLNLLVVIDSAARAGKENE